MYPDESILRASGAISNCHLPFAQRTLRSQGVGPKLESEIDRCRSHLSGRIGKGQQGRFAHSTLQ